MPVQGLRPTPDRVRETLFNWLNHAIAGAHCLDLFAGSGILGFEAASRGAAQVRLVDSAAAVERSIRDNIRVLNAPQMQVTRCDVLKFLAAGTASGYDLVFLDPPFRENLPAQCLALLDQGRWLNPGATIYVESESEGDPVEFPGGWKCLKQKTAGQVRYGLYHKLAG